MADLTPEQVKQKIKALKILRDQYEKDFDPEDQGKSIAHINTQIRALVTQLAELEADAIVNG